MHGTVRLGGLSIAACALLLAEARADDAPAPAAPVPEEPVPEEPPADPVPNTPPAPGYPAALVTRPLLLPDRALEGTVQLVASRFDLDTELVGEDATLTTYRLEPRLRAGFPSVEIEAALGLFLLQQDSEDIGFEDPDRLEDFFLAARFRRSPDSSVGVEVDALSITSSAPVVRLGLTLERKAHLSARSAYESALVVGVQSASGGELSDGSTALLLESRGRVQAQVTPAVAAEGRLTMRYLRAIGEDDQRFDPSTLGLEIGVGVVAAVTPAFDVVGAVDIVETGEVTGKIFTIGARSRRLP